MRPPARSASHHALPARVARMADCLPTHCSSPKQHVESTTRVTAFRKQHPHHGQLVPNLQCLREPIAGPAARIKLWRRLICGECRTLLIVLSGTVFVLLPVPFDAGFPPPLLPTRRADCLFCVGCFVQRAVVVALVQVWG